MKPPLNTRDLRNGSTTVETRLVSTAFRPELPPLLVDLMPLDPRADPVHLPSEPPPAEDVSRPPSRVELPTVQGTVPPEEPVPPRPDPDPVATTPLRRSGVRHLPAVRLRSARRMLLPVALLLAMAAILGLVIEGSQIRPSYEQQTLTALEALRVQQLHQTQPLTAADLQPQQEALARVERQLDGLSGQLQALQADVAAESTALAALSAPRRSSASSGVQPATPVTTLATCPGLGGSPQPRGGGPC